MRKVDIYDFDKTMVPFDSGSLFWAYCLLHYPWIIIVGPYQLFAAIMYLLGVWDLKKVKGPFFSFIKLIPLKKAVKKFWDRHEKEVFEWAKKENRERFSVIISASPDFLIEEIGRRIDCDDLICTVHDEDGKIVGNNCHDTEKVRLFKKKYPDSEVVNVYSDSIENDKFIFSLGQKCFHIKKGKRIRFNFKEKYGIEPSSVKYD